MDKLTDPQLFLLVMPAVFLVGTYAGKLINHWVLKLTDYLYKNVPEESYSSYSRTLKNWLVPFSASSPRIKKPKIKLPQFDFHQVSIEFVTGLLFAAYFAFYFYLDCLSTPEVVPDIQWYYGRFIFHLIFLSLLIACTATDIRDYVIPDQLTYTGIILAILLAAVSGQLQIIHLWVDWNEEIPGFRGPYIPSWLDAHRHLHGIAWSLAGCLAGGGLTWFARITSHLILGREALGMGDVTLMAMIGSFLGWQATLMVFIPAPLIGILCGIIIRLLTGRSFVAYGPYLCISAGFILFTFRWIWERTKLTFGDAVSIGILSGVALGSFLFLLFLLRMYRLIPGKEVTDEPQFQTED